VIFFLGSGTMGWGFSFLISFLSEKSSTRHSL
jgi:hypothetical protein